MPHIPGHQSPLFQLEPPSGGVTTSTPQTSLNVQGQQPIFGNQPRGNAITQTNQTRLDLNSLFRPFESPQLATTPNVVLPQFDRRIASAESEKIAAPNVQRLRRGAEALFATQGTDPGARQQQIQGLEAFGEGLAQITSAAQQAGLQTEAAIRSGQTQQAILNFQKNVQQTQALNASRANEAFTNFRAQQTLAITEATTNFEAASREADNLRKEAFELQKLGKQQEFQEKMVKLQAAIQKQRDQSAFLNQMRLANSNNAARAGLATDLQNDQQEFQGLQAQLKRDFVTNREQRITQGIADTLEDVFGSSGGSGDTGTTQTFTTSGGGGGSASGGSTF